MSFRWMQKMMVLLEFLVVCLWVGTMSAYAVGTVRLKNVSYPFTNLEVGNYATVEIRGSTPNGVVSYTYDGGGPYCCWTTDSSGNFTLNPPSLMTSSVIGQHSEIWYVNGVEVNPNNPNPIYAQHAPTLPVFTVYQNFTGTNCSGQSLSFSGCGTGNRPLHWVWSPVTYYTTSAYVTPSSATAKATLWNNIQSKIQFSSDSSIYVDTHIYDNTAAPPGIGAQTITYGYDCNPQCFNRFFSCNGACLNSAAVYVVDIQIDYPEITRFAAALDISDPSTLTPIFLTHEMGHALRLGDVAPVNGICSEVQDMMYPETSHWTGCSRTAPTSCDTTGINTVYPAAVSFCPTFFNYYCYGFCN